ncbi:hypothetical protein HEP89_29500 (plasmid) [Labrenzia sp. 5N]|uniref:hypothetical protein n=1 Tax=Labrenzia sp. 5N TaxID=2723402 RepID=UPI00144824F8|nr:hypothetical protein [Labrenzia sp. 5N]NKX68275.1 hypothetical protein [Labrenzia sp. 5N]
MSNLPTDAEVERAILNEIKKRKVRAGEIFPVPQVSADLQQEGFSGEEIAAAFERMVEKKWLEPSHGPMGKLLEEGFKVM